MKRIIELKHVGPKGHVRTLIDELLDRLEAQLVHFAPDAVATHVVFDENVAHKLYRVSVACHVRGRTVAAHEEQRDSGRAIREAFAELERQLEKYRAVRRREPRRAAAHRREATTETAGDAWDASDDTSRS